MYGGICEYCSDKDVRSPEGVLDTSTTSEVKYVEAEVLKSVIRLKESGVGVRTVEL